jgi:hypothetical protein
LVTGASWVDIEAILDRQVSDPTLRARRDEWIAAGRTRPPHRVGHRRRQPQRPALLHPALDAVAETGLHLDIATLHLDRGYDELDIQRRGSKPPPSTPHRLTLGLRWVVEATNTWWSNYGQLRRSTDRRNRHRHAALCLATSILIIGRIINCRNRWNPTT